MVTCCFATKVWKGDFEQFLKGAFHKKLGSVPYDFDHTMLLLNNGIPPYAFEDLSQLGQKQTIDVTDVADGVLDYFQLTKESFKGGYYYSIAELTAILYAKPYDLLCWLQGDCVGDGGDWVTKGIEILENNPSVAVVSPGSDVNTWNNPITNRDLYMSDQCFLIRVAEFLKPEVYHYPGVDGDYPSYGGNSFEAMVGKYLKATERQRQIMPEFFCYHENYGV